MKRQPLAIGQRVHIDADTREWGRVVCDATVVAVRSRSVQVSADSIRAVVTIKKSEVAQ